MLIKDAKQNLFFLVLKNWLPLICLTVALSQRQTLNRGSVRQCHSLEVSIFTFAIRLHFVSSITSPLIIIVVGRRSVHNCRYKSLNFSNRFLVAIKIHRSTLVIAENWSITSYKIKHQFCSMTCSKNKKRAPMLSSFPYHCRKEKKCKFM